MKIEHIAFNVKDPVAFASWYSKHFGLKVVCHKPEANQTHFLSDDSGTIIEIYCNPADQVPDYKSQNPLIFHLAFVSEDPETDANMLLNDGATWVNEVRLNKNTHLIMIRDPWGIAVQLCKRSPSLL